MHSVKGTIKTEWLERLKRLRTLSFKIVKTLTLDTLPIWANETETLALAKRRNK